MLGRTANDLFWLSRYIERAENIARLLEVGYRIVLLPREGESFHEDWRSTLYAVRYVQSVEYRILPCGRAPKREGSAHRVDTRNVGEPE